MKFARLCLLCALIPLGFGCASPEVKGSPAADSAADAAAQKSPAYLLRMTDYKSGAHMELVNESHTSHVDQYSKVRTDPSRKVTSDEWMKGLIAYLDDEGWSKEEKRGSAPAMAQGSLRWSLELVGPKGTSFVAEPIEAKGSQRTRLRTIQKGFLDTYNATQGFQAVHSEAGKLPFKVPEYADPTKTKKNGG